MANEWPTSRQNTDERATTTNVEGGDLTDQHRWRQSAAKVACRDGVKNVKNVKNATTITCRRCDMTNETVVGEKLVELTDIRVRRTIETNIEITSDEHQVNESDKPIKKVRQIFKNNVDTASDPCL